MNSTKANLLKKVYDQYIDLMLYDFPLDRMSEIIAGNVTGFGTTMDERVLEITGLKKIVTDQREQGAGLDMQVKSIPVHRRISPIEDSALYMDEFEVSMEIDGAKNVLPLRLTSVFEFMDSNWKLVHLHGSKAVEVKNDTWHQYEWKQKNELLQKLVDEKTADLLQTNRELEIEAALERVRARTMAMQNSEELAEVSYLLNKQVVKLGIPTRGCAFNIYNENDATEWFSNLEGTIPAYKTPRENIFLKYYEAGQRGESLWIEEFSKERIEEHYRYLATLNVVEKKEGTIKESVQIIPEYQIDHVAYFKYGYLLFITLEPAPQAHGVFKRFAKEFEQTYTRFLDLKKAEAQARESEIQLALERVRARTMAMFKSSELNEVAAVLFEQIRNLGGKLWGTGFALCNIEAGQDEFWFANEVGVMPPVTIPNTEDKVHRANYQAWKEKKDYLLTEKGGEELAQHYRYLNSLPQIKAFFEPVLEAGHEFPNWQQWHAAYFSKGYLLIITIEPYLEPDIFIRFAKVFEQTYTRFLDLQKAEAQVRESQIEAALEKVRSRTIGMQRSDELTEAAALMFQQIEILGVNIMGCGFNIWDEDKKEATAWMSGMQRFQPPFKTSSSEDIFLRITEAAQRNESLFVEEQAGSDVIKHYEYMTSIPVFKKILDQLAEAGGSAPSYQIMHCAFFKQGYLMFISLQPVVEAHDIFKRFAKVFEQTYTRFLDLQKAEAQAREAQIEAALERVRSRSLAMRKSDEVQEIVNIVFKNLRDLNIETDVTSVIILKEDMYEMDYWVANSDNIFSTMFRILHNDSIRILNDVMIARKKDVDFSKSYSFEEKNELWNYLFEHSDLRKIPEERKKFVLKTNAYTTSVAFTKNAAVQLNRYYNKPFTEKENEILKRFAIVFEQAYIRFLDLQRAETQAREAIKQASLDRVRGEIASMRTSSDLNRITPVIWHELQALEVPFTRSGVFIIDENTQIVSVYLSTPEGKALAVLNLSFEANNLTRNTVEHWRKKRIFKTHWNKEDFINWTRSMMEIGQVKSAESYQGSATAPESLNLHFVPFRQGMLYVGNESPLANEKIELVKTLAEAFSIAYARYEDFKQLEEAKNKIEITLNDLKAAQTQLVQAEKMASLGELTAGIAHEIQNPLNFVNNFSEVSNELIIEIEEERAKNQKERDEKLVSEILSDIRQNLEKINHHGKRADGIVKGMLQHSRSSSGVKEPTDINALADEYLRLSYHGLRAKDKSFNADFKTEFDETLPKINVIPQDIGRVLLNLINNAFYAVSEARSLKLEARSKDYKPTVTIRTKKADKQIILTVADNGNGIPDSIKDKIFQPFFTTKPTGSGTGLGLSLSYDIVKAHSGEIKVESEAGTGTAFIISLPLKQ